MAVGDDASTHAERQGHERSAGMSRRKAVHNRSVEILQERREHRLPYEPAAWLIAIDEITEHDRGRAIQHSGESQLRNHAIQPERPLADILEKQHIATRGIERVWRSE